MLTNQWFYSKFFRRLFRILIQYVVIAFLGNCANAPVFENNIETVDNQAPSVVTVTPADAEVAVPNNISIQVEFSEDMDANTLTQSSFTLEKGAVIVPGTITYDSATFTATYDPGSDLSLNTVYTITLTPGIKDKAGNGLISKITYTFTTDVCPIPTGNRLAPDGAIYTIQVQGCTIYIGGNFTGIGKQSGGGAVVDKGTSDIPLDVQHLPVNDVVYAALADGTGGWIIGGKFTQIGDVPRRYLAHIANDGSVSSWDPSPDNFVYDIHAAASIIFIAGAFTTMNGQARGRGAAFDSQGNLLSWNPDVRDGLIRAVKSDGTYAFLGGTFTNVGGSVRNYAAGVDLNGNLIAWDPNLNGPVNDIDIDASYIFLGGEFTTVNGGTPRNYAASYNFGGTLQAWNPNLNGFVRAIEISGSDVYLGGDFTAPQNYVVAVDNVTAAVRAWNPNINGAVRDINILNSIVYIGGDFTTVGATPRKYAAALHTDATYTITLLNWDPLLNNTVETIVRDGTNIYIGGNFDLMGFQSRAGAAAMYTDGTLLAWNPNLGIAAGTVAVYDIAIDGAKIIIGGSFDNVGGTARNNAAELLSDGTLLGWNPNVNGPVFDILVKGTSIYLGGNFTMVGGTARNYAAAVDTGGALLPAWNPNLNGMVNKIVLYDATTLVLGGSFTTIGGTVRNAIGAVNLTGSVLPFDPNANGTINDISISGGIIYMGGSFTMVGGSTRNYTAAVDISGTVQSWYADHGVTGTGAYSVEIYNSTVLLGSDVNTSSPYNVQYLSGMETTGAWVANMPLITGTQVTSIMGAGNYIIIGGIFTHVSGTPRANLAILNNDGSLLW